MSKFISAGRMSRHLQRIRFAMEWIEKSKKPGTVEYRDEALKYATEYLTQVRDELLEVSLSDVAVETKDAA
jgi:hypothetical protein